MINQSNAGILSVTSEAINDRMLQDPMLTSWSQGFNCDTLLSNETLPCSSNVAHIGLGANNQLPSHVNNMLRDYHIPEIGFDQRHIGDTIQSSNVSADLLTNTIPAQAHKMIGVIPHTDINFNYMNEKLSYGDEQCWF